MSFKSSKAQQGAVIPIQLKFSGGINYAQSPSQIADNELTNALNVIYNSQTGTPETRPGTICVTAAALPAAIRKIYYYEKSSSLKWLIGVSGKKLYYLDVDHWHEIGTDVIATTTVVPTFLTYNTYLLIADGSTNLRKWDGTTLSSLTDGLQATAIAEIGARVVINSSVDSDLVTFSGIEDETMWDTADLTNPAIGLRAGFGDNMDVNAFAVFGNDLLVSKKGSSTKKFYRINTAGVPTSWTVAMMTSNNSSQTAHTIVSAFNNVFFVDTNGFKSIKGVTEYGDLQVDMIGAKINTSISGMACDDMAYIPAYTSIWFPMIDVVYVYHRIMDDAGNISHAFTSIQFGAGRIRSLLQADSTVYLAGENGYLYALSESASTDALTASTSTAVTTLLKSKQFSFFGGGILRKTSLTMKALSAAGTPLAYLRASTTQQSNALLKTITLLTSDQYLFDATGDLYDATTALSDLSGIAWVETSTNRLRGTSLQFQIDSASGRFGVEGLQAEIALVGN